MFIFLFMDVLKRVKLNNWGAGFIYEKEKAIYNTHYFNNYNSISIYTK